MPTLEPASLSEDIAEVVRDAFGDQPFTEVESLSGGRSGAATFSLTVAGARYIARRSNPGSESHIRCLQIASDLGVAPKLLHADIASGITLMDRVDGSPVRLNAEHPEQITGVARALRRLHDGPAFPHTVNFAEIIANIDGRVRATGNSGLPRPLLETLGETSLITARVAGVAGLAPCHNDLNPGNILHEDGRIYFVDWDTAANNDPFFDLAEIGVVGCASPLDRAHLFHEYLGRAPSHAESAHAVIARVGALGFYSAAFSMVAALAGCFNSNAEPLPMEQLLATFADTSASPDIVAASLFAEMQRELSTQSYERAKRQLG